MHYPYIIPNRPSIVLVKSGVEHEIFRPDLSQAEDILVKKNSPVEEYSKEIRHVHMQRVRITVRFIDR
jgi:hypothetical protein